MNRIQTQDCMIKRELLIGFMTQRELDWACYRRGFNPHGKHRFEQESFLREWLRKSSYYSCEKSMAIRPGVSDNPTGGQPASFISRDLTRKHSISISTRDSF